ncbi:MAG: metallophosphoesterase [Pedobacter sp.]|nr:MAG: metallophosphoesterase [Pedobacter sp.]
MLRRLFQRMFSNLVIKLANKYSSSPNATRVHEALSALYSRIIDDPGKRGVVLDINQSSKIIIFSDQHKGSRNHADDFALSEKTYLAALEFYNENNFLFCSLGDSEELWKNQLLGVLKHNDATFRAEQLFLKRSAFIKIFGNHDLYWDNDPLAGFNLERIYGEKVKIYEGAILNLAVSGTTLSIFLTHGHQGDLQSDGNWFSKWFVSNVWAPFQSYLRINPNTPAFDNQLKSTHNSIMYSWTSKQSNLALITGHTHQPVFNSLTHLERVYLKLEEAKSIGDEGTVKKIEAELLAGKISGEVSPRIEHSKNTYFNTGCCCYSDGDITGIEIGEGMIRLIKWKRGELNFSRIVLEESNLENLLDEIK